MNTLKEAHMCDPGHKRTYIHTRHVQILPASLCNPNTNTYFNNILIMCLYSKNRITIWMSSIRGTVEYHINRGTASNGGTGVRHSQDFLPFSLTAPKTWSFISFYASIKLWTHRNWALAAQVPFCQFSWSVLLWQGQAALQLNPGSLLFGFLLSWSFSFTYFRNDSALSMLNTLNPQSNSLGKNLTFNLLVYNTANSMLSDTLDSSSFAMVTYMGHSFQNSTHSLDVYNTTFLPELQVYSNRNNSMFPKRSREHTSGDSHPSLCACLLANDWNTAVLAESALSLFLSPV